jgi:azurin
MKKLSLTALLIALTATVFSIPSTFAAGKMSKISLESKGEENVFKKDKYTVPAGAKVEITLKNNSTSMPHNFVLTQPGKANAVGMASMSAGEANNWVKESADVIFHTTLVKPKTSGTFTFTAPTTKGDYPFICSFPGHYLTMKGVLTVK